MTSAEVRRRPAIWKVTCRPRHTILAPIPMSLSLSVVGGIEAILRFHESCSQRSWSASNASVRRRHGDRAKRAVITLSTALLY